MKTVTVRAAVAVDPKTGEWSICGHSAGSDQESMSVVDEGVDSPTPQFTIITAEIPIREPAEVQATVEGV